MQPCPTNWFVGPHHFVQLTCFNWPGPFEKTQGRKVNRVEPLLPAISGLPSLSLYQFSIGFVLLIWSLGVLSSSTVSIIHAIRSPNLSTTWFWVNPLISPYGPHNILLCYNFKIDIFKYSSLKKAGHRPSVGQFVNWGICLDINIQHA